MNPFVPFTTVDPVALAAYTHGVLRARAAYYGKQVSEDEQRAKAVKQAQRMREHRARRKQQLREAEEASWTGTT